ncbi:hypothetical protein [Bacillus testis]|uniref:hypothetical protein n=1 Tax=Bacillus testis TaxID=1622072 RepID=UPI00067F0171|nr:hypothetical protein [Bacillus testis]
MKESDWNGNRLEEYLAQMPSIRDRRDPEWVRSRIEERMNQDRLRKKRRWLPFAVSSAAVACVATFATISLWQDTSGEEKSDSLQDRQELSLKPETPQKDQVKETDDARKASVAKKKAIPTKEETGNPPAKAKQNASQGIMAAGVGSASFYNQEAVQSSYATIALPLKDKQMVVPITVPVKDATVEGKLAAFLAMIKEKDYSKYGLDSFSRDMGLLSYLPDHQAVTLETSGQLGGESDPDKRWLDSLMETMRYIGITRLIIQQDGESGEMEQSIAVNPYPQRAVLVYQGQHSSSSLFVPTQESFSDLLQALQAMKQGGEEPGMLASIPDYVDFKDIQKEGDAVVVTFADGCSMEDNEEGITGIHAILLAAREFGFKAVRFLNAGLPMIGTINLEEEVDVPNAPNMLAAD